MACLPNKPMLLFGKVCYNNNNQFKIHTYQCNRKCITATFQGKPVAVKIVWDEESYNDEVRIYERLGAMNDTTIENRGIPKIYYTGKILTDYFCIIMTLFEGTLKDRFEYQNKHFQNITILLMFKRLVGKC